MEAFDSLLHASIFSKSNMEELWKKFQNVSIKNLECLSISAFEFPKTFPKNMEIFHNI
jgi:hypothetical protein